MSIHDDARIYAANALGKLLGNDPDFDTTRHLAGIGHLETNYGAGWRGAGKGSNNMGAITAGSGWNGATFEYVDTSPNPDGTSTPYVAKFRVYPTPQDGWNDLARVAFGEQLRRKVLIAAVMGDTYTVSQFLRETNYYAGFGPTQRDRVYNHFLALRRGIWVADEAQGIPTGRPVGLPPTLCRGDRGDHVKTLQRELQIAADGIFGPITEAQVKEYQRLHGLVVDGVVGPKTWTELFNDGYDPGD
jgi:peptidoglycan hydrolase-like protein with peptidoglycan-binding domain